jgi:hypothetical protein
MIDLGSEADMTHFVQENSGDVVWIHSFSIDQDRPFLRHPKAMNADQVPTTHPLLWEPYRPSGG